MNRWTSWRCAWLSPPLMEVRPGSGRTGSVPAPSTVRAGSLNQSQVRQHTAQAEHRTIGLDWDVRIISATEFVSPAGTAVDRPRSASPLNVRTPSKLTISWTPAQTSATAGMITTNLLSLLRFLPIPTGRVNPVGVQLRQDISLPHRGLPTATSTHSSSTPGQDITQPATLLPSILSSCRAAALSLTSSGLWDSQVRALRNTLTQAKLRPQRATQPTTHSKSASLTRLKD